MSSTSSSLLSYLWYPLFCGTSLQPSGTLCFGGMYHFPGLPQYCTGDYADKKHDRIHHSVGLLLYSKEDSTGLPMKGGKYHSAGLTSGCMYH